MQTPFLCIICTSPSLSLPLCAFVSSALSFINRAFMSTEKKKCCRLLQVCVRRARRRGGERQRDGRWLTRRWANRGEREWKERIVKKKTREGCMGETERERQRGMGGVEQNVVKEEKWKMYGGKKQKKIRVKRCCATVSDASCRSVCSPLTSISSQTLIDASGNHWGSSARHLATSARPAQTRDDARRGDGGDLDGT